MVSRNETDAFSWYGDMIMTHSVKCGDRSQTLFVWYRYELDAFWWISRHDSHTFCVVWWHENDSFCETWRQESDAFRVVSIWIGRILIIIETWVARILCDMQALLGHILCGHWELGDHEKEPICCVFLTFLSRTRSRRLWSRTNRSNISWLSSNLIMYIVWLCPNATFRPLHTKKINTGTTFFTRPPPPFVVEIHSSGSRTDFSYGSFESRVLIISTYTLATINKFL